MGETRCGKLPSEIFARPDADMSFASQLNPPTDLEFTDYHIWKAD
jgi:hypothetical protein